MGIGSIVFLLTTAALYIAMNDQQPRPSTPFWKSHWPASLGIGMIAGAIAWAGLG